MNPMLAYLPFFGLAFFTGVIVGASIEERKSKTPVTAGTTKGNGYGSRRRFKS